jgi:hypothetical protein
MMSLRPREEEVLSLVRVAMVLGKTGQVARDTAKVVAAGEVCICVTVAPFSSPLSLLLLLLTEDNTVLDMDEDVPTWETPDNNGAASGPTSHEEIGTAVFPLASGKPG